MRLGVDAPRQPADDDHARGRKLAAEHPRDLGTVGRARTRPNHGDSRPGKEFRISEASEVETGRRIVDRA